jgi:type I site-specific restriction endonuclease
MFDFPGLHFPVVPELQIKREDENVLFWDVRRKKYIRLTPEEWVRQHVIAWLESENYPAALISVERELNVAGLSKRFDIAVFDRKNNPFLLVECKRPTVKITEETLHQALIYNRALNAPYLMLTNGLKHYICSLKDNALKFLNRLPDFEQYP